MDREIEIKIQNSDQTVCYLEAFLYIAAIFLFALTTVHFSAALLLFSVISGAALVVLIYLNEFRPTLIWSDGSCLYWRHIFKTYRVELREVKEIYCEPYRTRSRFGTLQRIRLSIATSVSEIGEIEFNDRVNTNELLKEKLGNEDRDIPVLKLYNYLKERCGSNGGEERV